MPGVQTTASDIDVDLGRLFASLLKNWVRIVAVAFIVAALAFMLGWSATPHYRAETRILIETRESVFTRPQAAAGDTAPILDEEGVASQVEIIGSTDLLKKVAKQLDLASRPEFDPAANLSLVDRLLVLAGMKSDPREIAPEERVLEAFREKLSVYRVERSRVIAIEFSSEDPRLAAEVPNALAEAYIAMSREAKLQSNDQATEWLKPEIDDLTKRVKEAEARVASFRAQSDLFVGQNNSELTTQQLSELASELSRVLAGRAAAEAKARSVRAVLDNGGSLDSLPDVLSSSLIQRLRERQVELKATIAELSTSLLGNHPRIRALKSQLADLDQQVRNEAEKVLKGLETEAKTAQLREEQLTAEVNKLKAESARAGDGAVELRALEREAAAQRELLESYLARYREAASRTERNYLFADARIFSRAIVPADPYFPKIVPITAAAFAGSLLLMAVFTLLQELFSGRAMQPAPGRMMEPVSQVEMRPIHAEAVEPAPPASSKTIAVSALGEMSIAGAAERLIGSGASRALFLSPEGDDAAAAAVLVARAIADAGLRVLLLDLSLGGAASRPMLESAGYPGITNLLASEAQFSDVIHSDLYSDCHVIPAGTSDPVRAMRAADRLPIILQSLTTAYDIVIVECGPAGAESLRRLVGEGSEIIVSMLEADDPVVSAAAADVVAHGFGRPLVVSPAGHLPPPSPLSDQSAA